MSDDALALPQKFATWADVHAFLTEAPYHQELVLMKGSLGDPRAEGAHASIGIPKGQTSDFRFPPDEACQGLHVQDYGDTWRVHLDVVHPTCDFLGHLRADAPRLGAYAATAGLGAVAGGAFYGRRGALIGAVGGVLFSAAIDFAAACMNPPNPKALKP